MEHRTPEPAAGAHQSLPPLIRPEYLDAAAGQDEPVAAFEHRDRIRRLREHLVSEFARRQAAELAARRLEEIVRRLAAEREAREAQLFEEHWRAFGPASGLVRRIFRPLNTMTAGVYALLGVGIGAYTGGRPGPLLAVCVAILVLTLWRFWSGIQDLDAYATRLKQADATLD